MTYQESQTAMGLIQSLQLKRGSLDSRVTHCVKEKGPCPKGWEFFPPGVAQLQCLLTVKLF